MEDDSAQLAEWHLEVGEGHTAEKGDAWEALRCAYRPKRVTRLLIGESRPKGETFFYLANSNLFTHTQRAFEDFYGPSCPSGTAFLPWFAGQGWWLIDLCAIPVNGLERRHRNIVRRKSVPLLAKRIAGLASEVVVVTPKAIVRQVTQAVREAAIDPSLIAGVPFPAFGHQKEFRALLAKVLMSLEEDWP